ncbi:MAG: hypothetical protein KDA41_04830, partial [Planctomycetales bacterium]|nr:hypothetical protein [Planctomycetales bacterium]
RDPVAFDAPLTSPLRFREAISALHDVVISDLRYTPRDKSAYDAWKQNERQRLAAVHRETLKQAKQEILARRADVPADLEQRYNQCRARYWRARQEYSNYLLRHDLSLWRKLMPCDPVVTVADDVVFFECFSADESSYGCLTVERDAGFGPSPTLQLGTTNVDYSWDLYHHFQALRSYRKTRFCVDPQGIDIATEGADTYREEKVDLPPGWLRGFMQIQVAMGLPMRRVSLSRDAVYNMLAWYKRHKARNSPRAIRFELLPGDSPRVVLEPWEQPITSHATRYDGPGGEPIRVWGGRRLLALARTLPLAERFDVYLLGTGLPSFWVARLGEMRLTLGLSGWTANDWTHGSALDALAPPAAASDTLLDRVRGALHERRALTLEQVRSHAMAGLPECAAALHRLAHTGQAIYDLAAGVYRWRQIMPLALGEAQLGPENPELAASRDIVARRRVQVETRQDLGGGKLLLVGQAENQAVEAVVDADGMIKRGKCRCSHHYKGGLRMGPCRHLLALRAWAEERRLADAGAATWYERLRGWAEN